MRAFSLMSFLIGSVGLSSCIPAHPVVQDTGSADTDSDADSDSDVDSGPDSGSDTAPDSGPDTAPDSGHDSGPDTADSGPDTAPDSGGDTSTTACSDADLVWSAEVRDAHGTVGTAWTTSDDLYIYGIVTNTCAADVAFRTHCGNTMLTSVSITSSSGMGEGLAMSCDGVSTTRSVPAGGTIEEGAEIGRHGVASYAYTVAFDHPHAGGTGTFTVR